MGPFLDYDCLVLIKELGRSHITQGTLSATSCYSSVRTGPVVKLVQMQS